MKTFTNYAEKKAKQFLNLLQGYTKGIRMTAILILLLMGVSNVWARNIFFSYGTTYSWWKNDNAVFYAYFFNNGEDWRKMIDSNGDGIYECEIPDNKYTSVIIVRKNPSNDYAGWDGKWNQTVDLTISDVQNPLFTITGENNGNNNGSWTDTYTTATHDKFYIRGTFSNCSWDNSKHWQFDNSWKVTKNIAKGDYEFKVYASYNQWWGNNGTMTRGNSSAWTMDTKESNNCKINIDRTGDYTFTYDKSNRKLTVTYPEACFLVGSFNSWNENNTYSLINGSTTVHLTAGQHTFKIYNYSNSYSNIHYGNNGTMYRDNCTNWQMSSSEGNCTINADVEGDYIFTFDRSTMKLSVTYPQMGGCYLKGTFNNWSEDHSLESGSVNVELTKGNYTFKIYEGGRWYGNSGTMTRGNSSNWTMSGDTDCTITADITGNYTFTYNKETKQLTVTYPEAYKVTYGVGTNKGTTSVTTDPSVTSGDLVLAATPITFSKGTTADGYTWKNWNSKADGTGTNLGTGDTYVSSNRAGDITVYACYDLITYNITYNLNGGTGATNTTYNVTTATITLPTPSKTGYTFDGWYFESDFSGTKQTQITKGSTGNKTYFAKWTANQYTIKWDANGGTVDPTSSTYIYDGDPVVLPTPKREGYTFNGWFTASSGGERITDVGKENKPTSNVTYYAHWAENLFPVTISASANGSVTPSGEQQIGIVERSVSATANTGYQFKNWTVTGGAKVANANSASTTVTAIAAGTVTANFTAITYTITYNLNNGTGTMTPTSYTVDTETFNLPTPTRAGYTFAGWFEKSNLTGGAVTQIIKGSTGNKTFYAKWTEILSTITIEINPEEGGIVKVNGQQFTSGQTVEVGVETSKQITLQANAGYGIAAFKQEGAAIIAGTGTYTLKADGSGNPGKLIANFTKNSYTFTLVQAEGGNATATVNGKAISSPATLEHGTQITLNATAADKYKFSKWVNGNRTQVSTDNPYTHTLTANTTIQAVFTNTDILYLEPNENWKKDNAWFLLVSAKRVLPTSIG